MKKMSIRAVFFAIFTLVVQLVMVSPAISAQKPNPNNEQGSTHGQPFKSLGERIDIVSSNLTDVVAVLQGEIDALIASQADQDVLISVLQSYLNQLELRVLQNETDIASLQIWHIMQDQLIAALDSRIVDLEARVTINEGDIAAIILVDQAQQQLIEANLQQIDLNNQLIAINAGDIDNLEIQIVNLQNDITNLQAQITTNKGNINTLQTQVTNLQNDIINLQTQITNNDGDINTLVTQVANLQASITNLQIQINNKQARVLGVCPSGYSIRIIHANGNVTCELDNVSAGVGVLAATVRSATVGISASVLLRTSGTKTATCPSTHKVSGGGHNIEGGSLGLGHIDLSAPSGNGWIVRAIADSNLDGTTLRTYAQCLRVQ